MEQQADIVADYYAALYFNTHHLPTQLMLPQRRQLELLTRKAQVQLQQRGYINTRETLTPRCVERVHEFQREVLINTKTRLLIYCVSNVL